MYVFLFCILRQKLRFRDDNVSGGEELDGECPSAASEAGPTKRKRTKAIKQKCV